MSTTEALRQHAEHQFAHELDELQKADTHDLAVPGTPYSSSARSVASVATAISIRRRLPMYLALT